MYAPGARRPSAPRGRRCRPPRSRRLQPAYRVPRTVPNLQPRHAIQTSTRRLCGCAPRASYTALNASARYWATIRATGTSATATAHTGSTPRRVRCCTGRTWAATTTLPLGCLCPLGRGLPSGKREPSPIATARYMRASWSGNATDPDHADRQRLALPRPASLRGLGRVYPPRSAAQAVLRASGGAVHPVPQEIISHRRCPPDQDLPSLEDLPRATNRRTMMRYTLYRTRHPPARQGRAKARLGFSSPGGSPMLTRGACTWAGAHGFASASSLALTLAPFSPAPPPHVPPPPSHSPPST